MDQPPLDHHYVVQHLGGPKSVQRRGDGAGISTVAELGSITVVPAGTGYVWKTRGPIEFAHLYLPPRLLEHAAQRVGRSGAPRLRDAVGLADPLLQALFAAMLTEVAHGAEADVMYLDGLFDSLLLTLLKRHTSTTWQVPRIRESLTRATCRRIADYVDAHLHEALTLSDLQRLTEGSLYHFARGFRNSMGLPPHQYVLRCRIARAKALLAAGDVRLDVIARRCEFRDRSHLSKTFSRLVGQTCTEYRQAQSR